MLTVELITSELERETAHMREMERYIAQARRQLDELTAVLLESSGKIKGYRELLRKADEAEAAASSDSGSVPDAAGDVN